MNTGAGWGRIGGFVLVALVVTCSWGCAEAQPGARRTAGTAGASSGLQPAQAVAEGGRVSTTRKSPGAAFAAGGVAYQPPSEKVHSDNPDWACAYVEWHRKGWEWFVLSATKEVVFDDCFFNSLMYRGFNVPPVVSGMLDGGEVARRQILGCLDRLRHEPSFYREFEAFQTQLRQEVGADVLERLKEDEE